MFRFLRFMKPLKLILLICFVASFASCAGESNSNKLPTAKEINAGKFPEANVPRGNFPEPKQLDPKFPEPKQLDPKFPEAKRFKVNFPEPKFLDADFPEARLPLIKFSQTTVRQNKDFLVIVLPADVLFDFDKDEIRPDADAALREISQTIAADYAEKPLQVNGHTDSVASDEYNQDLSERRAFAVFKWLSEKGGIAPNRIQIVGFGEKFPVAPNQKTDGADDPDGRQKNRRVEIVIKK